MGLTIGLLFDLYNVTKGIIHPRRIFSYIGDLLFWVITTFVVFFMLLIGNWGELRFYVVIGITAGVLIYIKLLSSLVIRVLLYMHFLGRKTIGLIIKIFNIIWFTVSYPFVLIKNIIIIPVGYAGILLTKTEDRISRSVKLIMRPAYSKASLVKNRLRRKWKNLFKK